MEHSFQNRYIKEEADVMFNRGDSGNDQRKRVKIVVKPREFGIKSTRARSQGLSKNFIKPYKS